MSKCQANRVTAREWWEARKAAHRSASLRKHEARMREMENEIWEELRDARSR